MLQTDKSLIFTCGFSLLQRDKVGIPGVFQDVTGTVAKSAILGEIESNDIAERAEMTKRL